jgi:hypothetical protein
MTSSVPADLELEVLNRGDIEVQGRIMPASNATFFATAALDGVAIECVYKPVAGERPLWDFPDGTLAQREVAAYLVSEAMGWNVVPPTVLRADAPAGRRPGPGRPRAARHDAGGVPARPGRLRRERPADLPGARGQ